MSTQIEVKEPIKLLNKDGSLTQPGWARRNIIEYNREDIRASKWTVKEWDFYQVGCKDFIVQLNFFNISLASAATIGYVNLKTPFLLYPFFHLSPSFAVLSEAISILLIAPH